MSATLDSSSIVFLTSLIFIFRGKRNYAKPNSQKLEEVEWFLHDTGLIVLEPIQKVKNTHLCVCFILQVEMIRDEGARESKVITFLA